MYVYFMSMRTMDDEFIKIGCSADPKHRLSQIDKGPFPIKLIYVIKTDEMYELNVYTDSYEYKQTSNKDMALNYKIDRMVANRSHEDTKCLTTDEIAEKTGHPYIPDTDTSDQTDEWDYDDEIDDGWTYDNERNIWIEDEWVEDE